jgi:hypothetical protein
MLRSSAKRIKKPYGLADRTDPTGSFVNVPALFGTLLIVAVGISYLIGNGGLIGGAILVVATLAIPAVYSIVAYPKFGVTMLLVWSYFLLFAIREIRTAFPLGTTMDGLEALMILGFFIHQRNEPRWGFLREPVSILVLLWVGYNIVQVINPFAASMKAWLFTVRTVGVIMLMYFIFSYHIKTIAFMRFVIRLWLGLVFFGALYGLKQEFIGFNATEQAYVSQPDVAGLLFVGGFWRKFSIFSDPVSFGYNMVAGALLCVGLLSANKSLLKKAGLWVIMITCLGSMLVSGTRGAYVLFPAAMGLLAVIKFSKRVVFIGVVLAIMVGGLLSISTGNPILYRFQTAFKPGDDASFNVRAANQQRLKPYIQTHPIGGGLGATGIWGVKFAPDSYLAKVPPDSGYFRTALELGWVGLLLYCTLMFVVLKTGIDNYFKISDPELKGVCLSMTLIIFALMIGNYPQEAFVQFPTNIYLYLEFALINVALRLDREKNASRMEETSTGILA